MYDPAYEDDFDQLTSMRKFAATNYTISAEIELRSVGGPIQDLLNETKSGNSSIRTAGTL